MNTAADGGDHSRFELSGRLSEVCFDEIWESYTDRELIIKGETYRIASLEDYQNLGENPEAEDAPIIFRRSSDGTFLEVEVWVHCWPVTAQQKELERETVRRFRRGANVKDSGSSEAPTAPEPRDPQKNH